MRPELTIEHSEHNVHYIKPVEGKLNSYLIGTARQVVLVKWNGQEHNVEQDLHLLSALDGGHELNNINDALERLSGTTGTLCGVSGRGELRSLEKLRGSKGLAIDTTRKLLYHVDTFQKVVHQLDYDVDTGEAKNKKIFFNFAESNLPGFPDGMTIDAEGNVWLASFSGLKVIKVGPDGNILEKLDLKVQPITSATFGGPQLDTLYVTSGSGDYVAEKPPEAELLEIKGLGVNGLKNLPC